ncbi:hypothetical protein [Erythrobacter alti]|uniref:hypothetical protein n=1 Tax=Erythrobacter alti TaxID=1896145 RepID=UPI0030F4838E
MARPSLPPENEIDRLIRQVNDDPFAELRRSLGVKSTQGAIAEVMERHNEISRVFQEYKLQNQIAEVIGLPATAEQFAQFRSRLDFIASSSVLSGLKFDPGVADAIAELNGGLSASRAAMIALQEIDLPALRSVNETMRQMLEETSLKMTVLEAVGVTRGYFEETFSAARASLLGEWHTTPDLPDRFFTEIDYRHGLYRDAQVDRGLIEAPPELAVEVMIESGYLPRSDANNPEPTVSISVGPLTMNITSSNPTAGAREALDDIELRLREFIALKLEARFGRNWFKLRAPPDVLTNAKRKRKESLRAAEDTGPLINWTDIGDLAKIVLRNDNWSEVFEEFFADRERFEADMRALTAMRRPVAHARPIDSTRLVELIIVAQRVGDWIYQDGLWMREADSDE